MTSSDSPPEPPVEPAPADSPAPSTAGTPVPIHPAYKTAVGLGILCLLLWLLTLDAPFANPFWPPVSLPPFFRAVEPHTPARYSPAAKFQFNDVDFRSEKVGIGVAADGVILRTADGGKSWSLSNQVRWLKNTEVAVEAQFLEDLRATPVGEAPPSGDQAAPPPQAPPKPQSPPENYRPSPTPSTPQREPKKKAAVREESDLRQVSNVLLAEDRSSNKAGQTAPNQSQRPPEKVPDPGTWEPRPIALPTRSQPGVLTDQPPFPDGPLPAGLRLREVQWVPYGSPGEAWIIGAYVKTAPGVEERSQPGVPVLLHTNDDGRTWQGYFFSSFAGMELRRLRGAGLLQVAVLASGVEPEPTADSTRATGASNLPPRGASAFIFISSVTGFRVLPSPIARLRELGRLVTSRELWAIGEQAGNSGKEERTGAIALSEDMGETWKLIASLNGVKSLESLSLEERLAVDDEGRLVTLDPDGKFAFAGATAPGAIYGLVSSATKLWSYGEEDTCYRGPDGQWIETTVQTENEGRREAMPWLRTLGFVKKFGWVVRDDQLLITADEGATWIDPRRYTRLPSPASWLLLGLGLGLVTPIFFHRTPKLPEHLRKKSIANFYLSDAPLEDPRRASGDLAALAGGVARFLRNEFTGAPLVLGVCGPWGSGKSSLMNLIRAQLSDRGFHPVWFNAWHHEQESHLLAALLQNIREQAIPPVFSWHGLFYRMELARQRFRRRWVHVAVLSLAVALLLGAASALKMEFGDANSFIANALALLPLGAAAGPLLGLLRMLGAFGIDPGKLALGAVTGAKASDLREMTSFRHRFAVEFKEVTHALKPKRMVVFIDDLDRCQPDHMMKILETINFLSTSGEVFIVLSMEKRAVLACLAEKLTGWTKQYEAAYPEAEAPTPAAYAELRLEKLVQVEVTVPTLAPDEMKALAGAHPGPAPEEPPAPAGGGFLARVPWRMAIYGILLLAGLVAAACLGYRQAQSLRQSVTEEKRPSWYVSGERSPDGTKFSLRAAEGEVPPATPAARHEPTPLPAPKPDGTGTPTPAKGENASVDLGLPPPAEARGTASVTVTLAERSWLYVWIIAPCLLLAAVVVTFALKRLRRYFQGTVTDSAEFREAMERWWSEISRRERTPRALKRLVNRLRLYASLARNTAPQGGDTLLSERAIVGFGTMEEVCPGVLSLELGLNGTTARVAEQELERLGELRIEAEQVLRELKGSPAKDAVRRLTAALRT